MRRPFLAALLLLGTLAGYGSGIAHTTGCWHKMGELRAMRERHIAEVCLEAAKRANQPNLAPTATPAAASPVEIEE